MNREKRAPILGAIIGIIFSAAALGFLATPSSAATTSSAVSSADPGVLPAGYTQAEMDTDIAVDGFVQDILAKYGDTLQPSVDWGTSTILLAVKAPIPSELSALSGTSVAGLGVKVQEAKYSPADFDAIVAATGELSKAVPGLDQVEFYSMPADGSRIEAKVSNLDSLASSVETSLTSTLQKATGANIALVSGPMLTKNFSRQNDDDPWIGGGMMREANGGLLQHWIRSPRWRLRKAPLGGALRRKRGKHCLERRHQQPDPHERQQQPQDRRGSRLPPYRPSRRHQRRRVRRRLGCHIFGHEPISHVRLRCRVLVHRRARVHVGSQTRANTAH